LTHANEYVAVAFRTLKRNLAMKLYSRNEILAYFLECASNISVVLNELETNLTILANDFAELGDWNSKKSNDKGIKNLRLH